MKVSRIAITVSLVSAAGALGVVACDAVWCSTWGPALVCTDFDRSNVDPSQGDLLDNVPTGRVPGVVAVSETTNYTPPNSLLGSSYAFDGGLGSGVTLSGALWLYAAPLPGAFSCRAEIQVDSLSATKGDTATILSMTFSDAANPLFPVPFGTISIVSDENGNLSLVEDHTMAPTTAPPTSVDGGEDGGLLVQTFPGVGSLSSASFQNLHVDINTTGTTASFTAGVEGQSISGVLARPLPPMVTGRMSLGPVDTGMESTGWSFYYDNVICQ